MSPAIRRYGPAVDLLAITGICFGWAIYLSTRAMLGSASDAVLDDLALMRIVVVELALGSAAMLMLQRRGHDLRALVPSPGWAGASTGLGLYALTSVLCGWVLTPLEASFEPQPIDQIVESSAVTLPMLISMALVNGTYEEVFLLGFLARSLKRRGFAIALFVSLLVRASYHLYQGPIGVISVLLLGSVLTFYYLRTGSLFAPIVAHVAADVIPFL